MPKASRKKTGLRELLAAHQKKAGVKRRLEVGGKDTYVPSATSKSFKGQGGGTPGQNARAKAISKVKRKVVVPYSKHDRILMIGEGEPSYNGAHSCMFIEPQYEGNFSFALALITNEAIKVTPARLCATSYDSQDDCYKKYPEAEGIVSKLRSSGATVLFLVNAIKLDKHKELRGEVFDHISFNFPHVGRIIST